MKPLTDGEHPTQPVATTVKAPSGSTVHGIVTVERSATPLEENR